MTDRETENETRQANGSADSAASEGTDEQRPGEAERQGAAAEGEPEGAEPPTPEQRIAQLEADVKAHYEKMLRVAADFDNFRKRASRELEDARRMSQHATITHLLPVFDNLERATAVGDVSSTDARSMAEGLRMVLKQFVDTLDKLGIERVESVGKPFDPMVHESIQYEHQPDVAAGLIARELQAGYKQGDHLLRPALVVVSKGPAPEANEAETGGANEGGGEQA